MYRWTVGSSKGSRIQGASLTRWDVSRKAADRIADMVSAAPVRGGLAMFVFRRARRWALARASLGAQESAREGAWATRASDMRLRSGSLRPVAWTAVLEGDE